MKFIFQILNKVHSVIFKVFIIMLSIPYPPPKVKNIQQGHNKLITSDSKYIYNDL